MLVPSSQSQARHFHEHDRYTSDRAIDPCPKPSARDPIIAFDGGSRNVELTGRLHDGVAPEKAHVDDLRLSGVNACQVLQGTMELFDRRSIAFDLHADFIEDARVLIRGLSTEFSSPSMADEYGPHRLRRRSEQVPPVG